MIMTEAELTPLIFNLKKQRKELDEELYILECQLAESKSPYESGDQLIGPKGARATYIKSIPARTRKGYLCVVRRIKTNGKPYASTSEIWPFTGWEKDPCS